MAYTPLSRLGEWILTALLDLGGRATPREVRDHLRTGRTTELEPDDFTEDPDRPGYAMWESRLYEARRMLGLDDLVLSDRREWWLTEAGTAAARALAEPSEPAEATSEAAAVGGSVTTPGGRPMRFIRRSVIATPLLDKDERARIGFPTEDTAALPILIELNLVHPEGLRGAYDDFTQVWRDTITTDPPARLFDEYVSAHLSMVQIEALVREDQAREERRRRAVHRVWPDFRVDPLIDASARTVKADAAYRAFAATGAGVVWAVVDSGIAGDHPHFTTHHTLTHPTVEDLHRDFTTGHKPGRDTAATALADERGHGSHVAGIIAGALPEPPPEDVHVFTEEFIDSGGGAETVERQVRPSLLRGMAPETRLVSLKVLPPEGPSDMTRVMAALRYIREVNAASDKLMRIHGVNISLGYEFDAQWFACGHSPLCAEVDRLVRTGVVVVVAAGNTGYGRLAARERQTNVGLTQTINDPGNAERAITVGSTHRERPHTFGVSYFSSKGPTGDGRVKPDLVAPGERITSCAVGAIARRYVAGGRAPGQPLYGEETGTSFAAPHVSGVIAAFLSVRPEFVGHPERVKEILVSTATRLGRERYFEGGGLVDLMRALQSI